MNITLSQEAQDLLDLAHKSTKQPLDTIITKALINYLEDLEDYKSALEAEKRLLGNTSFMSIEDLAQKADINASEI